MTYTNCRLCEAENVKEASCHQHPTDYKKILVVGVQVGNISEAKLNEVVQEKEEWLKYTITTCEQSDEEPKQYSWENARVERLDKACKGTCELFVEEESANKSDVGTLHFLKHM